MLAFLTPKKSLQTGTRYNLTVTGVQSATSSSLPSFQTSFTTAGANSSSDHSRGNSGDESAANRRNAGQHKDDPAVASLQAKAGLTALSGQTRTVSGKYLANVTFNLDCDGKKGTARSDSLGRFLIITRGSGHCELEIDGTTAHTNGTDYGRFFPGVDLVAGQTNILPYTVWMTPIDRAHEVSIPSPTTSEVVVTAPHLKGLELHLPAGTVIRDYNGQPITRIGLTRIPIRRPPFPLPNNVPVPIYFTIQPGGAFVEVGGSRYTNGKGARLIYPNSHRAPVGMSFNFWDYDPDGAGWYRYGTGHVDKSRKNIVPDQGVVIHRFTGAMVATPNAAPPTGPPPGGPCPALLSWLGACGAPGTPGGNPPGSPRGNPGGIPGGNPPGTPPPGPDPHPQPADPIDPSTGLFVYHSVDYVLPDVVPFTLERTYRQGDPISRAFGVGTSQALDVYLTGDFNAYQYADLIGSDGSRTHFTRSSPGTGWMDAVFVSNTSGGYYGATIAWNGSEGGWELNLSNGSALFFPEAAGQTNPLKASVTKVKDRYGNALQITRDTNSGALTKVTTPNGRWIALSYDQNGHVIQARDNLGRTTAYSYDEGGRLAKVVTPGGAVTSYTYDANDQMISITDARGNVALTNEYDAQGRVIHQTLPENGQFTAAYTEDANGNVVQTQITDSKGVQRNLSFSASGYFSGGQVLTDTRAVGKPEQQTFTYSWTASSLLQSITDPLNRTTSFAYDSNGNRTNTTVLSGTANAVPVSATYNGPFNEVASVTDPISRTVTFGYDGSGNLTTITKPLNLVVTNTFNSQGQLLSTVRTGAGTINLEYTAGLPTGVIDPLSNHSSSVLDALGRTQSASDPLGNTASYEYDADNRVITSTDPLHNQTQFAYDANGNPVSITDTGGGATTFTYDNANRVQTRQDPLQAISHFSYDANGNLASVTDRKNQTAQFAYDTLNRLTQITYADSSTVSLTYDGGNRVTQVVDSLNGTIGYSYDLLNHPLSKTNSQGTVSYTYNAAGQRTSMTVAGQTAVNYTYDAAGRVSQISQGSATVTITYDTAGRRASLTLPNGVTAAYSYDDASRLTEIDYANSSGSLGSLTYQYDSAGRRIAAGGSLARTALPAAVSSGTYNAANQLTQWNGATLTYDANGNLTNDSVSTYSWDVRNELASISGSSVSAVFLYNGSGQRTAKQVNGSLQQFLFAGANVVQEQSATSVTANLLTGLGLDENYARTDASGSQFFLADGANSTLALTDASGSVSTQYTFDPFGTTTQNGASTNSFQYTGRENDGTGLYYLRARYYSPKFQRFLSQDPVGFAGGINPYAYAAGDPINLIDPLGTDPKTYDVPLNDTAQQIFRQVGQQLNSISVGAFGYGDFNKNPVAPGVIVSYDSQAGADLSGLASTKYVGYELPLGGSPSPLVFIPVYGVAGLFYQPGGTIGVYAGGQVGAGVYLNLGGGAPGR